MPALDNDFDGSVPPDSNIYYGANTIVSSYGITMFNKQLLLYTAFCICVNIMHLLYSDSYFEFSSIVACNPEWCGSFV
jgi:hypothetical protein